MSHEVRGVRSSKEQSEDCPRKDATYSNMGIPRKVSVEGMRGVVATVVVTVVQGKVWMSVSPPFTWEAIMESGKVDELMHVLELAREDAKEMSAARSGYTPPAVKAVVRAIAGDTATQ